MTEPIVDTILFGENVMWPDSQSRQNSSRQPSSWTDSKEVKAKREQNPELIVSIVKIILLGQNVMLPDFKRWTEFK